MNAINLLEIENIINTMNPNQIVKDINDIRIGLYYVKYGYTTCRNNRKVGVKYFITDSINPQINLEEKLRNWVKDFNANKPHRAISNVKFLEGSCIGLLTI